MQDKDGGLNRRDFIKWSAGAMGLLAALSSPLLPVLNRARASSNPVEKTSGKQKVRAWCMVIDLKKCDG